MEKSGSASNNSKEQQPSISHFFRSTTSSKKRSRPVVDIVQTHRCNNTNSDDNNDENDQLEAFHPSPRRRTNNAEVIIELLSDDDDDSNDSDNNAGKDEPLTVDGPTALVGTAQSLPLEDTILDGTNHNNVADDSAAPVVHDSRGGFDEKGAFAEISLKKSAEKQAPPESEPVEKRLDANGSNHNRFAKFAFGGESTLLLSSVRKFPTILAENGSNRATTTSTTRSNNKNNNKGDQTATKKGAAKEWVRMKDISPEEQNRIIQKWHSLADPTASLEDRRFHVLVAARLHARCQEGPTRKAMEALRATFDGSLTVQALANVEPDCFIPAITNLQYYFSKAKQLTKASQEIQSQFGGHVPETEHSLKQITGIGPVLADLLAFVNTRERHQQYKEETNNETNTLS